MTNGFKSRDVCGRAATWIRESIRQPSPFCSTFFFFFLFWILFRFLLFVSFEFLKPTFNFRLFVGFRLFFRLLVHVVGTCDAIAVGCHSNFIETIVSEGSRRSLALWRRPWDLWRDVGRGSGCLGVLEGIQGSFSLLKRFFRSKDGCWCFKVPQDPDGIF